MELEVDEPLEAESPNSYFLPDLVLADVARQVDFDGARRLGHR